MNVYFGKQLVDKISKVPKIKRVLWPRLFGIDIETVGNKLTVEPIYIGFCNFHPGEWCMMLELNAWRETGFVVFLGFVSPYFKIWRITGIALDYEEVDDD